MENRFINLAIKGVRELTPYQPGKPMSEVERELGISNLIKLASNENALGPSPKVIQAIQDTFAEIHLYPDANGYSLKKTLSEFLGVSAETITLGNGSNELIEIIARTFVSNDHEIIFSEYAFIIYKMICQAIGAKQKEIPALDWGHDLEKMAAAVTDKTRLIFIANPNNPTGTWISHDALLQLLNKIPEHVLVVLDEAYYEYVDEADYPDSIALQKDFPNLIILRTFSKAYALASLRVGFCLSHPDVANLLNRVRQPFNVNSFAQKAAEIAVTDFAYLKKTIAANKVGLQTLVAGVEALGLSSIPSVTNFLTIDFKKNAMPIYQKMLQQGVIVRPIANYDMPNHLRVTVGLSEENKRFLDVLAHSI